MKKILVIGAGRSSGTLISYLEENSVKYNWRITVADLDAELVKSKITGPAEALKLDIFDEIQLDNAVKDTDLVISLIPARFHPVVAIACLEYSKSLITPSYETEEMKEMDCTAQSKNVLFLNEMGVDPGIDHMSAMNILDRLRKDGHELICFESFTGGLIAPESDNNPWHYKFTWNPDNVVLSGQEGPAKFIQEGKLKYIPYNRLFRRTEKIFIEGYGDFEGYANRNSLNYIEKYNLQGVPTVYRGTLRRPGFCRSWDIFIQLGATDNSYVMHDTENMTYKEFINSFLYYSREDPVRTKLLRTFHIDQDSNIPEKMDWLEIFSDKKIGVKDLTPAQVLMHILRQKWKLDPGDKDMIVMWHKFIYKDKSTGKEVLLNSSMGITGDNDTRTAMSKSVGLPLGIAAKMILTGQIPLTGVHIPTRKEIYEPVLSELEKYGFVFKESVSTSST